MEELEKLRIWAVHGNWGRWGPFVTIFEALDSRIAALEETTELHDKELTESALSCDRRMKKLEKPTHLSCCEGCGNKECGIRGRYGGDRRPSCYQLQIGLHFCCVGCVRWPCPECQVHESIYDFRRRVAEMKCYREKHTCGECAHALELDKYDDILCLRASVWQHPRFEYTYSTGCKHHYEREDK